MPFKSIDRFRLFKTVIIAWVLFFGMLAMFWFATRPANASEAKPEVLKSETAAAYVGHSRRIDIGGRFLNLNCMGSGEIMVLFESGGSDWSVIWALVQPLTARRFKACSYDRAGLGYSDPSPLPRTPAAIVDDMKALVETAKLPKPFILVGHSLGGFNAKLYAAMHPGDVAGLVLVDPSEDRQAERNRQYLTEKYGVLVAARSELSDATWISFLLERYRGCARLATEAPLDPASIDYRRCSDPVRPTLGPEIAAERKRIQVSPSYQQAQASEILNSVYGDARADAIYARLFRRNLLGNKPLIVLTHGNVDRTDIMDVLGQETMIRLHRETARLSKIGVQRVVEGSGHNIEIDKPMAVVDAIEEVGRRLKSVPGDDD